MQVEPEAQVVGPVKPVPPHCPYLATVPLLPEEVPFPAAPVADATPEATVLRVVFALQPVFDLDETADATALVAGRPALVSIAPFAAELEDWTCAWVCTVGVAAAEDTEAFALVTATIGVTAADVATTEDPDPEPVPHVATGPPGAVYVLMSKPL